MLGNQLLQHAFQYRIISYNVKLKIVTGNSFFSPLFRFRIAKTRLINCSLLQRCHFHARKNIKSISVHSVSCFMIWIWFAIDRGKLITKEIKTNKQMPIGKSLYLYSLHINAISFQFVSLSEFFSCLLANESS